MDNKNIYNFNLYLVYHIYFDLFIYITQDISGNMQRKKYKN